MQTRQTADISVIIPTYKRPEKLRRCLESLLTQAYPLERAEIIVVDDLPSPETANVVQNFNRGGARLRYLAHNHQGPAAARNAGWQVSTGNLIAFVDDDCTVAPDWIRRMVEAHGSHPHVSVVGGLTATATGAIPALVGQFLATCAIQATYQGRQETIFFPTCNVSFKRAVFERYAFDERFSSAGGEDLELCWRLFKDGHRFVWDKTIQVLHDRDVSFVSFVTQAMNYGRGNLLVKRLHKDQPLLKELETGMVAFWCATAVNLLKIPRFSYRLGTMLIREQAIRSLGRKMAVYSYFALHKIFSLAGNVKAFLTAKRKSPAAWI